MTTGLRHLTGIKAVAGTSSGFRPMSLESHILAEHSVPRYTSYPTAPHFKPDVGADVCAAWLAELAPAEALSLYLHVPFCAELCLYCGCHTKAVRRRAPLDAYAENLIAEISLLAGRLGAKARNLVRI
jgi:oxygen-independent coproporphyrinogen III oxidase